MSGVHRLPVHLVSTLLSFIFLFLSFYLLYLGSLEIAASNPTEVGWAIFFTVYALSAVPFFYYAIIKRPGFVVPVSFMLGSFLISVTVAFGIFAYFQYIYLEDILIVLVSGILKGVSH